MLKIGQVGGAIKSDYVEDIDFSQLLNLSDFDVIIIDVQYLNEITLEDLEDAEGEDGTKGVDAMLACFSKSIVQMKDFFEHGGMAIAFLSDHPMEISEAPNSIAGKAMNVFDFLHLDVNAFEFEEIKGSAFDFVDDLEAFTSWFDLRYHYVFKSFEGQPVLRSKKKKDVVGIRKSIGKGSCYLLPGFDKAASIAHSANLGLFQLVLKKIHESNAGKSTAPAELPVWLEQYTIYDEQRYLDQKRKYLEESDALDQRIFENDLLLNSFQKLKRLIYAGDEELEQAVEEIFREIGFNVSVPAGNNDDLHIIEEGFTAVVEIKGATKSGTTMHVMQLEKWVSNYGMENEGSLAKGILVLNPFREKKPTDRKENPFPRDMVNFSTPREHCLLLSENLLKIYIDFKEKLINKQEIQELISNTKGILKYNARYKGG